MLFKDELNDIFIEVALNDILFEFYWTTDAFITYYYKSIIIEGKLSLDLDTLLDIPYMMSHRKLSLLNQNLMFGNDKVIKNIELKNIITDYDTPLNDSGDYEKFSKYIEKTAELFTKEMAKRLTGRDDLF